MYRYILSLSGTILLFHLVQAQPGIWSDILDVSTNRGTSVAPEVARDEQDDLHLVWEDNTRLGGGLSLDILYSHFDGQTWSPSLQLSGFVANYSKSPQIAVDGTLRPHAVWFDDWYTNEGYFSKILYSFRQDSAWTQPLVLSEGAHYNWWPDVAVDTADHIYVIWDGSFSGSHQLLYRVFDDNQWGAIETVTSNTETSWCPKLRVDSQNHLQLVWINGEGYSCQLMYSKNNGQGWSTPEPLPLVTGYGVATPDIVIDENDYPHVVWKQALASSVNEIYYSYFNGSSWTYPQNITNLNARCYNPKIAQAAEKKFVTFLRDGTGIQDYLCYTHWQNSTWTNPDTLFPSYGGITAPVVYDSRNFLHSLICCCYGMSNNHEILHINYLEEESLPLNIDPHTSSIFIPLAGGSFVYDVTVSNVAVLPVTFDLWIDAVLPNGTVYGPIILRPNLNLTPGDTLVRTNITQYVPGAAPAGEYWYRLQVGDYPEVVVSADSFSFTKEGANSALGGEWSVTGWEAAYDFSKNFSSISTALPEQTNLIVSPNPFNPSTAISYELRATSFVNLKVYDTAGRLVETLVNGWREAGEHQVAFDGSDLTSGVYLYQIQAGDWRASGKMVLLK